MLLMFLLPPLTVSRKINFMSGMSLQIIYLYFRENSIILWMSVYICEHMRSSEGHKDGLCMCRLVTWQTDPWTTPLNLLWFIPLNILLVAGVFLPGVWVYMSALLDSAGSISADLFPPRLVWLVSEGPACIVGLYLTTNPAPIQSNELLLLLGTPPTLHFYWLSWWFRVLLSKFSDDHNTNWPLKK